MAVGWIEPDINEKNSKGMMNISGNYPCEDNDYLSAHISLLRESYYALTRVDMLGISLDDTQAAIEIFHAPAVVLSHDTHPDPILNYVNQKGLELFEMDWARMIKTPSRLTAESIEQQERQRLLDKVSANGFIDDYSGIRISSNGRRFKIEKAIVWNLIDKSGVHHGQAAMFSKWKYLD